MIVSNQRQAREEQWASWAPIDQAFSLTNTIPLPYSALGDETKSATSTNQDQPMTTHPLFYFPGPSPIEKFPRI